MTDKQAGWHGCTVMGCGDNGEFCTTCKAMREVSRPVSSSPHYTPQGSAVEAAYYAWDHCTSSSKLEAMRAALTAAFPELLARIEALEEKVLQAQADYHACDILCGELRAEVDRLRKGVV